MTRDGGLVQGRLPPLECRQVVADLRYSRLGKLASCPWPLCQRPQGTESTMCCLNGGRGHPGPEHADSAQDRVGAGRRSAAVRTRSGIDAKAQRRRAAPSARAQTGCAEGRRGGAAPTARGGTRSQVSRLTCLKGGHCQVITVSAQPGHGNCVRMTPQPAEFSGDPVSTALSAGAAPNESLPVSSTEAMGHSQLDFIACETSPGRVALRRGWWASSPVAR